MDKILAQLRRYEIVIATSKTELTVSAIKDDNRKVFKYQAVRCNAQKLSNEERDTELSKLINHIYKKISNEVTDELQLLPTN